ncbi:MAG: PD40 domain-containing protein [Planctomycetes bacterium]|nr:PD40 domain-containing protein [Planctomycetota bacterium]
MRRIAIALLACGCAGGRDRTDAGAVPAPFPMRRVTEALVGQDLFPSTSADGKRLYFSSDRHGKTLRIYARPIEGGLLTIWTTGPGDALHPAPSPDGRWIAYTTGTGGRPGIALAANAPGAGSLRITEPEAECFGPAWAPDGRRLAYTRRNPVTGEAEIWIKGLQGDPPAAISDSPLCPGLFPVWSPAGDEIAFQRERERAPGLFGIWIVRVADGARTPLVEAKDLGAANPSWSPDGQWIAFNTAGPTQDIWAVDREGGRRERFTFEGAPEWNPCWGADGWIYFCRGTETGAEIWALRPPFGSAPEPAADR